ncbi:MAG: GWxTD domain-containing protein [Candidatus Aminicenantes bacterium]|nr:MAG: GWxTD domain-containing protein [Candidatus Aminicenantes bacterium]
MKKKHLTFIILFSIVTSLVLAGEKTRGELPQEHKKWLEEEVVYIISPIERDVFLKLQTDRERELFIQAFWNHRDPTQGTPENEFRKEHYRRISYANYSFGRGVPKPGWKTDRGRIYIILGEPGDIEQIIGETQVYNTEIWFYQGLTRYGLPAGFNLIFFQKDGVGEYILYRPTSDGPQALMTSYLGDQADYLAAFRALKKISPNLARNSLSLIPGESTQAGRPSLSSDILLQNIITVPQKELKDKYAQKFLMYKDIVEVDYTANYIDNESMIRVIRDPSGIDFVHYVVELKRFSVQNYQDKYSTHLIINGLISDLKGKTIYQYEKPISVELTKDELKRITYRPVDFYDMFPLLPGDYKFSFILKNEVSKEFTTFEEDIVISEKDSFPRMSRLILSYRIRQIPSAINQLIPFALGREQIRCQPKRIFHPKESLFVFFQILDMTPDLERRGRLKFEFFKGNALFLETSRTMREYQNRIDFREEFPLQNFPPDYYGLKVTLWDGNQQILSQNENFEITPAAKLPRPWVYSKPLLPLSNPVYPYVLGVQLFNKGKFEEARVKLETAYNNRPDSLLYALNLARVYFVLKKYDEVKQTLISFFKSAKANYDVYFLLGKSHQFLGEFNQAVSFYEKAISHFGVNLNILNSLGECHYRLGNLEEALAAWQKSLEINLNQPEIKKKVESIRN